VNLRLNVTMLRICQKKSKASLICLLGVKRPSKNKSLEFQLLKKKVSAPNYQNEFQVVTKSQWNVSVSNTFRTSQNCTSSYIWDSNNSQRHEIAPACNKNNQNLTNLLTWVKKCSKANYSSFGHSKEILEQHQITKMCFNF